MEHVKNFANNKNNLKLLYLLALLLTILPEIVIFYISPQYPIVDAAQALVNLVIFLILMVYTIKFKKMTQFIGIVLLFFLWRSGSSLFLHQSIHDLSRSLSICNLVLLINACPKKYYRQFLLAISMIMGTYVILNFITVLLFKNGIYQYNDRAAWLLGINNQFNFFTLPAIVMIGLSFWLAKGKLTLWFILISIVSLTSMFLVDSMTGLANVFLVTLLCLVFVRRQNKYIFPSFLLFLILYVAVWLFIIGGNSSGLLERIFVDLLNRDITFSGRDRVWEASILAIQKSPWVGYGINTQIKLTYTEFVAHNIILQTLLDSGVIGFMLFSYLFTLTGIKLQKHRKQMVSVIVNIGIFGILIGGIMESYNLNYLFVFLALGYYVDKLMSDQNLVMLNEKRLE